MFLTYAEYLDLGGTLDEFTFNDLEFAAESVINYVTFNRLANYPELPEGVKRLTLYIINMEYKKGEAMNLGNILGGTDAKGNAYITSQSNDGVSVTYNGMPTTNLYNLCKQEVDGAAKKYLYGITDSLGRALLYRGLYPGE